MHFKKVAKLRIASISADCSKDSATPCKKNCNGDQAAEAFTEGLYMETLQMALLTNHVAQWLKQSLHF